MNNTSTTLKIEKPITRKSEDFLHRSSFAESIAKAITDYEDVNQDSLTIGLFGKWGSGKTSIVNMALEVLEQDSNVIVYQFEPWIYSDTQQLISHFFKGFAHTVSYRDSAETAAKMADELETYATFFQPISLIPEPTVSILSLVSSKVFGDLGRSIKKWANLKAKNISETKSSIENHLLTFGKKVLIVIDDIDRLNNNEIRQIFQMVKVLGDFPNTIYMLIMDKSVVTNALSQVQTGDGSEYLEKIIHVPFEVPSISQNDVISFLFKKLDEIVTHINEEDFDNNYWGNIFHSGFKSFFGNIRDVTRYATILRFNYSVLKNDVNIIDLIAVTAFQVFEPRIFELIKQHKNTFAGHFPDSYSYNASEAKEEVKSIFEETFGVLQKLSVKDYQKLMQKIFPKIDEVYNNMHYSGVSSEHRKKSRVCSPEFFDSYFSMTLDENEISNAKMLQFIKSAQSEDSFRQTISVLLDTNNITRFLERIQDYTEREIPESSIQIIFNVLMDEGDTFPKGREGMFSMGNTMEVMRILNQLSHRFEDKEKRYELFKQAIEKSHKSIYIAVDEIGIQMQQHGEYEEIDESTEDRKTLTSARLQDLKKLLQVKIIAWVAKNSLFEHPNALSILYLWKRLDNEKAIDYIHQNIVNDRDLVYFLTIFIYENYSHSSGDYVERKHTNLNYKNIKDFIAPNDVIDRVRDVALHISDFVDIRWSDIAIHSFMKYYDGILDENRH